MTAAGFGNFLFTRRSLFTVYDAWACFLVGPVIRGSSEGSSASLVSVVAPWKAVKTLDPDWSLLPQSPTLSLPHPLFLREPPEVAATRMEGAGPHRSSSVRWREAPRAPPPRASHKEAAQTRPPPLVERHGRRRSRSSLCQEHESTRSRAAKQRAVATRSFEKLNHSRRSSRSLVKAPPPPRHPLPLQSTRTTREEAAGGAPPPPRAPELRGEASRAKKQRGGGSRSCASRPAPPPSYPPYATALTPRRHPLGSGAGLASPRRSSGLW
jgi:hypothetical protein